MYTHTHTHTQGDPGIDGDDGTPGNPGRMGPPGKTESVTLLFALPLLNRLIVHMKKMMQTFQTFF